MATIRSTLMSRSLRGYTGKRRRGFTLAELLVSVGILVALTAVVFGFVVAAQASFNNADAGIQLRNIFRNANEKMAWELSHTGSGQYVITAGGGVNGSDIIRFSVPVACDTTSTFLDAASNPAYWGAYLTWGCDSVACADANGVCSSVEYKYVQYALNASGAIVRSVLSPALNVVASAAVADSITDVRFSVTGTRLTFTLSGQKKSLSGAMLTASTSRSVRLMN